MKKKEEEKYEYDQIKREGKRRSFTICLNEMEIAEIDNIAKARKMPRAAYARHAIFEYIAYEKEKRKRDPYNVL